MDNLRTHGAAPFMVAVLHGGPGAPGSVASLARELGADWGTLEPLQTADSIAGQVEELRATLDTAASLPATVIGWSWGAMLGFIFAARYPAFVRKLLLVASGPYEERYARDIERTRLARLSADGRKEALALLATLNTNSGGDRSASLARLGALFDRTDSYDPLPEDPHTLKVQEHIFQRVWSEAEALRASGELLALGRRIECPVVAIHGDYDPHPAAGVRDPLSAVLRDFRFILLERCGHSPWAERAARDQFYRILRAEVRG